jgi:hypothetical protein
MAPMTGVVRRMLGGRSRRRMRWARRHLVLWTSAALVVALLAVMLWPMSSRLIAPSVVTVAAAGDMACDPADPDLKPPGEPPGDRCRHQSVSDLAVAMNPDYLLALGDVQYEVPTGESFRTVYGPSWGRLRDRTVPVFGNQEYKVQDASSFTAYFGDRIRDPRGYWSEEIGQWHLVVLNSNCSAAAGGCGIGSPQQTWLAADLAANDARCVVAAWHHPRWSNGIAGPDDRTADLYRTLYEHRVELVLSGHEAHYERFGPLDPEGKPDEKGVRQFVAGTGGQAHYRPDIAPVGAPASEYTDFDHHGVLGLTLRPDSYEWGFHPLEGETAVEDEGEARCQ